MPDDPDTVEMMSISRRKPKRGRGRPRGRKVDIKVSFRLPTSAVKLLRKLKEDAESEPLTARRLLLEHLGVEIK